jgi:hypothetical protein
MQSSSSRSVVLSSLSQDQRESLFFSLASEIDPNNLHFSLLPDADNPNRDPSLPVVAVTWKLPRRHPVLSKIVGGTEFPQYNNSNNDNEMLDQQHKNNNNSFIKTVITPRRTSGGASPNTRNKRQQSPLLRKNTSLVSCPSLVVVEQIRTVSPVIRGSPTPFVKRFSSPKHQQFHQNRSTSAGSNGSSNNNNNYNSSSLGTTPRSPQWAQRYIDEFLHFAARSGVDTVQHNSISFAVQCFLQYQSAVASTIRQDFRDLEVAMESYRHVCPACRLLYFLWRECDAFSGVAALPYISSVRFNDQVVNARQIISLTSKVQTVAGHTVLINRKYLRANETVGVLKQATRKWNMNASLFAKRQVLTFLKSSSSSESSTENAIAFDYIRHVDFYAFLFQLCKCYVMTNAGRSGPVYQQQQNEFIRSEEIDENENEEQNQNNHHQDPYAFPEKVGGSKYQKNEFYSENVVDVNVSPNTPGTAKRKESNKAMSDETRINMVQEENEETENQNQQNQNYSFQPSSTFSYAQRFQEKRQIAKQQQQNEIPTTKANASTTRSSAWAKRIDSAQETLQQVMRQFDSPLSRNNNNNNNNSRGRTRRGGAHVDEEEQQQGRSSSSPPQRNNSSAFVLREFHGDSSPHAHSAGRRRILLSSSFSPQENLQQRGRNLNQQQQQEQKSVETIVVGRNSRSKYVNNDNRDDGGDEDAVKSVSMSAPRARSMEPPQPQFIMMTKNNKSSFKKEEQEKNKELDPISIALAEQVRKTLEARQRSERSQSQKSQLEMIAGSP